MTCVDYRGRGSHTKRAAAAPTLVNYQKRLDSVSWPRPFALPLEICPWSTHTAMHKSDTSRVTLFMKTAGCTRALSVVLVSLVLWTTSTWAQPASPESRPVPQEQFTCQLAGTSDRREIGIYRSSGPQHCRVDYTRDGTTRSLWSSRHDNLFCVRKALEIVGLLQSINFKCSPHSAASGSKSTR